MAYDLMLELLYLFSFKAVGFFQTFNGYIKIPYLAGKIHVLCEFVCKVLFFTNKLIFYAVGFDAQRPMKPMATDMKRKRTTLVTPTSCGDEEKRSFTPQNTESMPPAATPAPINPPTKANVEDEGSPARELRTFQSIADATPARSTRTS